MTGGILIRKCKTLLPNPLTEFIQNLFKNMSFKLKFKILNFDRAFLLFLLF